ncbi:MAG: hypothetical protein P9M14_01435 [Candidatus Alcyoniella australis]|nr:hypothetical protein [Candidatus Alcyoniella australis]
MLLTVAALAEDEADSSFFDKSLHATGNGMRYWYEKEGGFMSLTGIPYDQLDCSNCHVKSCDQCHAEKRGENFSYSGAMSHQNDTCFACHSREKGTFGMDRNAGCLDVHMAAGFSCSRCHRGEDVHGNGTQYTTMRDQGAVDTDCLDCHSAESTNALPMDSTLLSHTVHGDKLDCSACHVQSTFSCNNCHFDTFLRTGSRKGTFIKNKDWLLLVNYEGKVTSGTAMSLVTGDKKFVGYGPYYTHSISRGRHCESCHANEAVKLLQAGESVPMMSFEDGKATFFKGVVPAVTDQLEWAFLDKDGDKWVLLQSDEKPLVQWFTYGSEITQDQLKKLAMPFSGK